MINLFLDLLLFKLSVGVVLSFIGNIQTLLIKKYSLFKNYQIPFNNISKIKNEISKMTSVVLTVYDILGNMITILVNEEHTPGTYEVTFNGSNLNSGVYFYKLCVAEPAGGNGFQKQKEWS